MFNAIDKAKSKKQTQQNERTNTLSENGNHPTTPSSKTPTPPNTLNSQKNPSKNNNSFWNKAKFPLLGIGFCLLLFCRSIL